MTLRERYLEIARGSDPTAQAELLAELDTLDAAPPGQTLCELRGLSVADLPSRRFRSLRFIDAHEIDEAQRPRFARPCPDMPELAAVFVDPEQFCFANFEHILGLDRLFEQLGPRCLRGAPVETLAPGIHRFALRPSKDLRARLDQLDRLGLYTPPLHTPERGGGRGGGRFIFHSAELADALTRALKRRLPQDLRRGFHHVNPVFRCNRFEPEDPPFTAHLDSPFSDPALGLVSKATLLVYLSGGRGDPALRFEPGPDDAGLSVESIEALHAFVFDQDRVHTGGPYLDKAKVLLRSELIYKDADLASDPEVAAVFAKACYLDGHGVFAPELNPHAARAYDRAAAARWRGGLVTSDEPEPFVHKTFAGVDFISNGYDFWFHPQALSLVEGAALTLLDVLNARLDGDASFRQLCASRTLLRKPGRDPSERAWIAARLRAALDSGRGQAGDGLFERLDPEQLIPCPERPNHGMGFPSSPDFSDEPFPSDWNATRHPKVVQTYAGARRWTLAEIFAGPITMLGHELYWQPERFVVGHDKIHVISDVALGPVHFAGAVWYRAGDFVAPSYGIEAPRLLVPPILHRREGSGDDALIRLSFDLFRNGWMVHHESRTLPVPQIVDGEQVYADSEPWLYRAAGASGTEGRALRKQIEADSEGQSR